MCKTSQPEYESAEDFAEYLFDDDRTEYTHTELGDLAFSLRASRQSLRKELDSYGLQLARRAKAPRHRTLSSSDHDRWYGPGSSKTHGGTGF